MNEAIRLDEARQLEAIRRSPILGPGDPFDAMAVYNNYRELVRTNWQPPEPEPDEAEVFAEKFWRMGSGQAAIAYARETFARIRDEAKQDALSATGRSAEQGEDVVTPSTSSPELQPKAVTAPPPSPDPDEAAEKLVGNWYKELPEILDRKDLLALERSIRQALDEAEARGAARSVPEETGWLIEHEDEPKWLTLRPGLPEILETCWTKESLEALRFCRRSDAEDYISAHFGGEGPIRITEHRWV